jgi:chemotaxis protein MotB
MSSRRHRAVHAEAHDNAERWLLTYADMITLLLALFIVLFALSTVDQKKFLAFKMGLTQTFNPSAVKTNGGSGLLQQTTILSRPGTNPSPKSVVAGTKAPTAAESAATVLAAAQAVAAEIRAALARAGLAKDAAVTVTDQGVVVQVFADKVFFSLDSASFDRAGNAVIDAVGRILQQEQNRVQVEGYTDSTPVTGGPYPSNWALSAARAANVVNRMNVVDGVVTTRLSATGYGVTRPQLPNSTPANRARNRRIDIVILNS